MRSILFRGKRVDNGEWVEGSFLKLGKTHNIQAGKIEGGLYASYVVYPETVGQFTGLTNKNGIKVFEGDEYEYRFAKTRPIGGHIGYACGESVEVGTIEFNNGCFGCVCTDSSYALASMNEDITITGTIHDKGEE
jgi:hypothetical protein